MSDVKESPVSNKQYDVLKRAAQLGLPAVGTFYAAVAALWGLPHPLEVVGTITALNTLLGVVVVILGSKYEEAGSGGYFDGTVHVRQHEEGEVMALELTDKATNLASKNQIILRMDQ